MHTILESIGLQLGPGAAWLLTSTMIFVRYVIPASLVFFLVYKWKREAWFSWKIQQKFPKPSQIREEITYSALTSVIFGGMAIGVFVLRKMGYGELYFDISEHGWAYYFFSLAFMIFAHDTYFYWVHRLMHHPRLFKSFHLVHHKSANPTPYTSFSFHPLESVVEFAIIPLLTLVMPIHASAFFIFTLWSIAFNVMGHTGYEFSPSGFTRHPLFKWLNTPTHHNMHHNRSHCNFGLYFNIWDRLMGTNHPDYDRYFEQVVQRAKGQITAKTPGSAAPKSVGITLVMLFCSQLAIGQLSLDDVKDGHYGTPEYRTSQLDAGMKEWLSLRDDQLPKVHEINLRYSKKVEKELIEADLSDWAKYRKMMKLQEGKDAELKQVLSATQFEKYVVKRDELLWKAVKELLF